MFYKYLMVNVDGKDVLYLYLNNREEYASEFIFHRNEREPIELYRKICHYVDNMGIDFTGDMIYVVVNDVVVVSLDLSNYDKKNDRLVEIIGVETGLSNKFIDLDRSSGIIERLKMDDYIFGVVSGEMPAVFHDEALKAQAVIARTYASKRLSKGLKIKDYNAVQIYRDKNYLKEIWGNHYEEYTQKIRKAIKDTENEVLMFDGDYIDAYYHLSSNGKTEDSSNVLKLAYPYLVSVSSFFETDHNSVSRRIVPNDYLSKLLQVEITKDTPVEILVKTIGHRVKYVKFGDKVFDGLILARRLGLNSNDFSVSIEDSYTTFTTRGHGHGLGLSKYGAEGMAKAGYTYRQILEHYYPNTYLQREVK